MKTNTLGIDIAKVSFSLCLMSENGKILKRAKASRCKLLETVNKLADDKTVIAMESCGGSHHWAREFTERGFESRLIAGKFVKPFVKSQKNDAIDAEAICEASQRPRMRFVSHRTKHQQDVQCLVGVRSRLVKNRTALCNEIRGFLLEYGITVQKGVTSLRKQLPAILEENQDKQSEMWLHTFRDLYDELTELDGKILRYEQRLGTFVKSSESCKRTMTVPGVGMITSAAVYGAIGDPQAFKNGRQFAAAMGLVPQQFTTGGVVKLGRISKRGNRTLRTLLVQGAQSVVNGARRTEIVDGKSRWVKDDETSRWIRGLYDRAGRNKTVVAVANKTARRVWAVLSKKTDFIPPEELPQAA